MNEKVSIMCSWCGWENPSLGLRAARRWRGLPYAALRPRDGFSHPHQEHLKDTYILFRWTLHFVYFVDRAIHELNTPTKYLLTIVMLRIRWNPRVQVSTNMSIVVKPRNVVPTKLNDSTLQIPRGVRSTAHTT